MIKRDPNQPVKLIRYKISTKIKSRFTLTEQNKPPVQFFNYVKKYHGGDVESMKLSQIENAINRIYTETERKHLVTSFRRYPTSSEL